MRGRQSSKDVIIEVGSQSHFIEGAFKFGNSLGNNMGAKIFKMTSELLVKP